MGLRTANKYGTIHGYILIILPSFCHLHFITFILSFPGATKHNVRKSKNGGLVTTIYFMSPMLFVTTPPIIIIIFRIIPFLVHLKLELVHSMLVR